MCALCSRRSPAFPSDGPRKIVPDAVASGGLVSLGSARTGEVCAEGTLSSEGLACAEDVSSAEGISSAGLCNKTIQSGHGSEEHTSELQ